MHWHEKRSAVGAASLTAASKTVELDRHDSSKISLPFLQARYLIRSFGLQADRARLVAELAMGGAA